MSESNTAAVPLPIITPASTSTPKGDTQYVLLASYVKDAWMLVSTITARDPDAAIKTHVETLSPDEQKSGTFVAVNAKFWKPVTPAVEVVTTKTITLKAAN